MHFSDRANSNIEGTWMNLLQNCYNSYFSVAVEKFQNSFFLNETERRKFLSRNDFKSCGLGVNDYSRWPLGLWNRN